MGNKRLLFRYWVTSHLSPNKSLSFTVYGTSSARKEPQTCYFHNCACVLSASEISTYTTSCFPLHAPRPDFHIHTPVMKFPGCYMAQAITNSLSPSLPMDHNLATVQYIVGGCRAGAGGGAVGGGRWLASLNNNNSSVFELCA